MSPSPLAHHFFTMACNNAWANHRLLAAPVPVMRRAGIATENATRLLAHLFQHQIHHRGQAHAMLAGTTVKPPQLDEFFCANEAHLRAAELAELGLSESAIWGKPSA